MRAFVCLRARVRVLCVLWLVVRSCSGVIELEKDANVVKTAFPTSREWEDWKAQMVIRHEHADAQLLLGMARFLAIAVHVFT